MSVIEKKEDARYLYLGAYTHYKELILSHELLPGTRLPSIRESSKELGLSRTTIEAAYALLADEGYCIARPGSGYYVTEVAKRRIPAPRREKEAPPLYDLASGALDPSSFRLEEWRRYLKGALRQEERLLSYGNPQGEEDLRQALCDSLFRRRNILCSPEEVVIGAGTQSLLTTLCPLLKKTCRTVSLPTRDFHHQRLVFDNFGFEVRYRNKDSDILYVSPGAMTKWGDVMDIGRRNELIRHARERESLVVEDDYGSEFIYSSQAAPALYALAGGRGVVYLGSFSRLLLPSIPLSFMILPPALLGAYRETVPHTHQSASMVEQIALASYLADGKLESQLRYQKRLYGSKRNALLAAAREVFGEEAVTIGPAGGTLLLTFSYEGTQEELAGNLKKARIRTQSPRVENGQGKLLVSCFALPEEKMEEALHALKEAVQGA